MGKCPTVTAVIPGRDAATTIGECLQTLIPLLEGGQLDEIIFVDDGSIDDTARIVASFPSVRYLKNPGSGVANARNLGVETARTELVWLVDADCVARHDALDQLQRVFTDEIVGVGGSYENLCPQSIVATLIHGEIIVRHQAMEGATDALGAFNVLYRRDVLLSIGGFEGGACLNRVGRAGAEDFDVSFQIANGGRRLLFTPDSRVGHFHPTSFLGYLRTQMFHGRFRVHLYARHPQQIRRDSYSECWDYPQPLLAILAVPLSGLALSGSWAALTLTMLVLAGLQLPMAIRLQARGDRTTAILFVPFGVVRAFARGLGIAFGVTEVMSNRLRRRTRSDQSKAWINPGSTGYISGAPTAVRYSRGK